LSLASAKDRRSGNPLWEETLYCTLEPTVGKPNHGLMCRDWNLCRLEDKQRWLPPNSITASFQDSRNESVHFLRSGSWVANTGCFHGSTRFLRRFSLRRPGRLLRLGLRLLP